jgi:hypothetical protein
MLAIIQSKIFVFPSHIRNQKIKIYKIVILPAVLHRCETWPLILREEHRLRVFEKRVLWRIFGPKTEGDRSLKDLQNDELHSLYISPNIFRVIKSRSMRRVGHVARMGRGELFTGFWLGSPRVGDQWEDLDVGGRIILSWTLGR